MIYFVSSFIVYYYDNFINTIFIIVDFVSIIIHGSVAPLTFSLKFYFIVGKSLEVDNSKKYSPGIGPVVDKHCYQCGLTFKIGGPIWSEPMHDETFVKSLLSAVEEEKECYATIDRIIGGYICLFNNQ